MPTTSAMPSRSNPPAKTDACMQHRPFVVVEQLVRPPDGLAQAALALRAGQHPEAVGEEPLLQVDRRQRDHPRRRQLDPEREPVEAAADLGHRLGGRDVVELEGRVDRARTLDEERDGRRRRAAVERRAAGPASGARRPRADPRATSRAPVTVSDRARIDVDASPPRLPRRARSCRGAPGVADPASASASVCVIGTPACGVIPSAVAIASGTESASATGASSTSQTPSGNSSASVRRRPRARGASCRRRPRPVSVTSRWARTRSTTSASSNARPTSVVAGGGRFPRRASIVRSAGNVGGQSVGPHLEDVLDPGEIVQPVLTEIDELGVVEQRGGRGARRGSGRRGPRP